MEHQRWVAVHDPTALSNSPAPNDPGHDQMTLEPDGEIVSLVTDGLNPPHSEVAVRQVALLGKLFREPQWLRLGLEERRNR